MITCDTIPAPIHTCKGCGKQFQGHKRLYCTSTCGAKARSQANAVPHVSHSPGVSSGTCGAIAELIVAAHLLRNGWEVFRNIAPNGPADLMVRKNGITLDIDVTSGVRNKNDKVYHSKQAHRRRAGTIAILLAGDEIIFDPPLPA